MVTNDLQIYSLGVDQYHVLVLRWFEKKPKKLPIFTSFKRGHDSLNSFINKTLFFLYILYRRCYRLMFVFSVSLTAFVVWRKIASIKAALFPPSSQCLWITAQPKRKVWASSCSVAAWRGNQYHEEWTITPRLRFCEMDWSGGPSSSSIITRSGEGATNQTRKVELFPCAWISNGRKKQKKTSRCPEQLTSFKY